MERWSVEVHDVGFLKGMKVERADPDGKWVKHDDVSALVASWGELCGAVERFNAVADEGLVGPIDKVTFEACKALRTALANAKAAKGGK